MIATTLEVMMAVRNVKMRACEEPADCSNVSKIAHRYILDFQEFLRHCQACQEVEGIGTASNSCTECTPAI